MLEYIRTWDEACYYAGECRLDLSPIEGIVPLFWIGVACFVIYLFNEWNIRRKEC